MAKGRPGQKYIFSTQFLTVDELLGTYEEVTGRSRPWLRLPGPLMAGLATAADLVYNHLAPNAPRRFSAAAVRFLRMQRRADCTKAKSELGYQPTSLVAAIREAYEFFCRRGLIQGSGVRGQESEVRSQESGIKRRLTPDF
jgi:nucleoside-diphosphate-sugar epimerase